MRRAMSHPDVESDLFRVNLPPGFFVGEYSFFQCDHECAKDKRYSTSQKEYKRQGGRVAPKAGGQFPKHEPRPILYRFITECGHLVKKWVTSFLLGTRRRPRRDDSSSE
eukprot:Protomagalhaensia_sp_Gyna_25__980@NODE_1475_length_1805_cov_4_122310_g1194_i0_p3_GENE_NODE_1475_length_1805_cov_4_122310_g1194_i0NODE_1475_length_1805_cov_4_122310_g1194_i0_p3_ORF_typecomplete_len109_score0_38_NODE_1475_length_1805_cov_4_122310_g1194_i035361